MSGTIERKDTATVGGSPLEADVMRLKSKGFTGFYYPGECGCSFDDPAPCGEDHSKCKPGYKLLDQRPGHVEVGDWAVFGKMEVSDDDWERITY